MTTKILFANADQSTNQSTFATAPEMYGLQMTEVETVGDIWVELKNTPYDILLLDLDFREINGMSLCQEICSKYPELSVVVLSERNSEVDQILALEFGADDYISKPLQLRQCVARIKAHARRRRVLLDLAVGSDREKPVHIGGLTIHRREHIAQVNNKIVPLTAREFELLLYLAERPGAVVTKADLLSEVWGYSNYGYESVVTSFVSRVRSKLQEHANGESFIQTVYGVGYKMIDPFTAPLDKEEPDATSHATTCLTDELLQTE